METRAAHRVPPVRAEDYPHDGTVREQLRFCLHYAVLAPSSHNTQPWRFRLEDSAVEIHADRARSLAVVDPFDRELVISCGAALLNLRVAIEHFGREAVVEILPDPAQGDLLARVELGSPVPARRDTTLLFSAIPERRTNRNTFEDWPVPEDLLRALETVARDEGAWLAPLRGEEKNALADLIAEGDRVQYHDRLFRLELSAWTTPNLGSRRDGIPGYSHGHGDAASVLGPLLIRTFDWSRLGRAAKDRQLAMGSPVLAVLGTEDDDVPAWMAAGLALERTLLEACVAGLQSSFLNQPIEVAHLRPRLRKLLDRSGFPQLVLRLGYGPEARPTPRRDLDEVLFP
jgi:hypothetical protein